MSYLWYRWGPLEGGWFWASGIAGPRCFVYPGAEIDAAAHLCEGQSYLELVLEGRGCKLVGGLERGQRARHPRPTGVPARAGSKQGPVGNAGAGGSFDPQLAPSAERQEMPQTLPPHLYTRRGPWCMSQQGLEAEEKDNNAKVGDVLARSVARNPQLAEGIH